MSDFSWADTLAALVRGEDLDEHASGAAMRSIMSGEATPGQIGAFLIALRAKGETVDEITGLARVMREFSLKVPVDEPVVDTCGTGGDRAGTANISTMAALAVAGARIAPMMAEAVHRLGSERAMVFRGDDGLDELSTTTTSAVWDVDGGVTKSSFDPASLGLKPAKASDLSGGSAEENARLCLEVLAGGDGPLHDAVALNAGAALLVAGVAPDLKDGLARARESLDSGAAAKALDAMRETSQRHRPAYRVETPPSTGITAPVRYAPARAGRKIVDPAL